MSVLTHVYIVFVCGIAWSREAFLSFHPDEPQLTALTTDVRQKIESVYVPSIFPKSSHYHLFNLVLFIAPGMVLCCHRKESMHFSSQSEAKAMSLLLCEKEGFFSSGFEVSHPEEVQAGQSQEGRLC